MVARNAAQQAAAVFPRGLDQQGDVRQRTHETAAFEARMMENRKQIRFYRIVF
jgi:hypothetical protein